MIPQLAFILSCSVLYKSYEYMDVQLWVKFPRYGGLDAEKQAYVIKNILKAIYLAFICVAAFYYVVPSVLYGVWDNQTLRTFASLYVSNDIVGLYRVTKLHTSTRLHHMTAAIFLMAAWTADFQHSTTAKMLAVYTIFSAMSFGVNLYLGLRFLMDERDADMEVLKNSAKVIYGTCCTLNWGCQCYMAWGNEESMMWAYLTALSLIVWDDILLLKWFLK